MNQPVQTFPEFPGDDASYQIVLQGIRPDVEQAQTKANLAALFKASIEQIEHLLAMPSYVVKKGVPYDVASDYKHAIEAAGGVCDVLRETAPVTTLDVDLPEQAASAQSPASAEPILFQGDASLVKGRLGIVLGHAIGTSQQFVFSDGKKWDIILRRADIRSAQEVKHGFNTKWVVQTSAGESYQFIAENRIALRRTMLTLSGQEALAQTLYKEPDLSAVRNRTAWIAAFGPTLSGFIAFFVGILFGWNWDQMTTIQALRALLFVLVLQTTLIFLFLRIDHVSLQHQGFDPIALGIATPQTFPLYLFSRAKAFGHGKGYAITWCVTFGLEVLFVLAAFA